MPTRSWREVAESLAADLRNLTGDRFRALVVYEAHGEWDDFGGDDPSHGSLVHTLGLIDAFSADDLARCAALVPDWKRRGLDVPLLMSPEEFRRSLDVFPLEFSQILSNLRPVVGGDVLSGLSVSPEDFRRACESQVKSHLLHLREGYLEAGGSPAAVTELVLASAVPLRALLANLARLKGVRPGSATALLEFVERELKLSGEGLRPILLPARKGRLDGPQVFELYTEYVRAVEALATAVDEGLR